jgi:hypothetical protein
MQRTTPNLDNLLRKATAARHGRAKAATASETIRPPSRIIRTAFTDAVSQLLHA